MIRDLKPYPEYKDSGVPSLGEIPSTWDVRRNGRLFAQRNQTGRAELPILEVSLKTGVRVRDLGGSNRKQVMADREKYKLAATGDIAYNMMRLWQGAVGIAPVDGLVSPAYVVARPFPDTEARYFSYLFRTHAYMQEVNKFSRGIVSDRNRLYWEDFKQMPSVFPPIGEQRVIADFLDALERRVHRYIRAKQKLIKLLEEQKQAIIHRAVTRGLDPDVRLKPSGVEWLGDVPEHWGILSLGLATESIQTGPFGSQLHASDYVAGGVPVINPSHMKDGQIQADPQVAVTSQVAEQLSRHKLSGGDLVVARRGELGRCAIVLDENAGWICGTGSLRVRVKSTLLCPEYLLQILSSPGVRDSLSLTSVGATMDNLNEGMLARLRIPIPPVAEQMSILEAIQTESRIVSRGACLARQEIDLVREYRVRLIADVVTGKLDVREAANQWPDDFEEAAPFDDSEPLDDEAAADPEADAVPEEAEA